MKARDVFTSAELAEIERELFLDYEQSVQEILAHEASALQKEVEAVEEFNLPPLTHTVKLSLREPVHFGPIVYARRNKKHRSQIDN